jgi:hypothetical protein
VDGTGVNAGQTAVMQRIANSGVRFAVTVGDNGYPSGSQADYGDLQQTGLESGSSSAYYSAIFGPNFWAQTGSTVPLFTAVGNHGLSGTAHTDIKTWTQDTAVSSSNGTYANGTYACCTSGTTVNYGNEWYAFDAGPARFYILDSAWGDSNGGTSTPYGQDYANHFAPGDAEYTWLLNDLQAHPGTMKFAFMHYPWYSTNSSQTSDAFMTTTQSGASQSIESMLGQYGVKIVFNGHAHIYQRNNPSGPGKPVTYVTGGGGAVLEPVTLCTGTGPVAYSRGWSPTKLKGYACGSGSGGEGVPTSASQVFHFLKVTISGSTVTVTPTDANANTFDQVTYDFGGSADTVIDSGPASSTNATSATFTFHATVAGATFACSLDGAPATACTSPADYSALAQGTHTFSVAATANGSQDPSPATASWAVDTIAPSAPTGLTAGATNSTTVTLSWSASSDNEGVAGYDVIRNGSTIATVSGPGTTYTDASAQPDTTYTYAVSARDQAGNVSGPSGSVSVTTPATGAVPTLVQAGTSTSTSVTLNQRSTAGDLLVLAASVYTGATNNITKVTDDAGNTWAKIGSYSVSGHNSDGELWYAANAKPASTITVNLATIVNTAVEVQEFSGIATTAPLDTSAGTSNTGTTASSGPLTPQAGNELLVGFVAGHANSQAMAPTAPGFTDLQQVTTGASVVSLVSGYKLLGTATATSYSATFPSAMYWAGGVAAFRSAG